MANRPSPLELLTEERALVRLRRDALNRELLELDEKIAAIEAAAEERLHTDELNAPFVTMPDWLRQKREQLA